MNLDIVKFKKVYCQSELPLLHRVAISSITSKHEYWLEKLKNHTVELNVRILS